MKSFAGDLAMCLILFQIGFASTNKLCKRILFNHGDEIKMPYVQFEGIYRTYTQANGYPVFKHEQRNYYIEFVTANTDILLAFTTLISSNSRRSYAGLKAKMTNEFKSAAWVDQITDPSRPFQRFISRWEYYDWQTKTHILIGVTDVSLTCVPVDIFRCSSKRIYFNTTFTNAQNGMALHNYLTDYFEELSGGYNDYKNYRKKYRHSRQSHWILYYESPYWKVRNDQSLLNRAFLRAKDSCFRPEYITAHWEHLDGYWKNFTYPAGIRCRGFMQYDGNGKVKSCSQSDPCLNGGICVNSLLTNETICRCSESQMGLKCNQTQKRCSKYYFDSTSVENVIIYGLETSNFASVFCRENYNPQYFLSQCITSGLSSSWSPRLGCTLSQLKVSYKSPHMARRSLLGTEQAGKSFNFDDYPVVRPLLLAIVILTQLLLPSIHAVIAMNGKNSGLRILSIHAFIAYICWWTYNLSCRAASCENHGKILEDFIVMGIVMIPLTYIFMFIESFWSEERQYLSSMLTDVSVVDFVTRLRRTDSKRDMLIECYHWETRTRTVSYTDANGNTQLRTETYQEIVITYTEGQVFPVRYTKDVSDPEGLRFDSNGVTRLRLTQDVQCGDEETKDKFNQMRQKMIDDNKHRDVLINFTYSDVIDGFKERMCAYTDLKYRPWWMNSVVFWVSALFGLNWIFRIIFNWRTKKCEYTIKKLIYCTPRPTNNEPTGLNRLGGNNIVFHGRVHNIYTLGAPSITTVQM